MGDTADINKNCRVAGLKKKKKLWPFTIYIDEAKEQVT